MSSPVPPCAGQWELFDSLDYYDHRRARQLCATCPMVGACLDALAAANADALNARSGPRGTWAGLLIGGQVADASRLAAEEAMFSIDEARAAHSKWAHTPKHLREGLTDRVRLGERVYQRRIKRGDRAVSTREAVA